MVEIRTLKIRNICKSQKQCLHCGIFHWNDRQSPLHLPCSLRRKEVLATHPNLITTIRGSDAFILDYHQLQKDCPDFIQQFIIESDVMIITLQIPFMKKVLSIYEGDLIDFSLEDNFLSDQVLNY
jgi:hypothetical protein